MAHRRSRYACFSGAPMSQATRSGAPRHAVAPELACWAQSCGTRSNSGAPLESRGGGPELPGMWQHLSPLTWGAWIQSCGTHGGTWMLAPPLVLTWSLYVGYPIYKVLTLYMIVISTGAVCDSYKFFLGKLYASESEVFFGWPLV
jgi:hypothetical protein